MAIPNFVYPDEARPSLSGIDAINAKGFEYPSKDENGSTVPQSITTGSTAWILTPRGVTDIGVLIEVVSGTPTVKLDIHYGRIDEVKINATSGVISLSNVTATTRYDLKSCTAIRLTHVSGSGTSKLHYRGVA